MERQTEVTDARGSASGADRDALAAVLAGDPAAVRHDVGPLVDAWR
jgi:hypothetical protein